MTNQLNYDKKQLPKQYNSFEKAKKFVEGTANYENIITDKYYKYFDIDITNKKILDLGCGGGEDLFYLHQEKQAIVYGVDASEEMVKIAQDKNHNGIIKVGHVDNIPFEDNTFDIVISKWALQLVEYIDPVYKEILRVLKPGGNLIYLSSSPIRQFLLKKSPKRNYFKKEIIKTSFFKGEITDFQPSHTLTEYLSPFFLSHFMLEEYDEGYYESSCENLSNDVYPMYFIIKARSIK